MFTDILLKDAPLQLKLYFYSYRSHDSITTLIHVYILLSPIVSPFSVFIIFPFIMSVMWQNNRYTDHMSSHSSSATSNDAYGGWFAKQNIPQHMYNKYGGLNSSQLYPVATARRYHTPTESDMSVISAYRSGTQMGVTYENHVPYPSGQTDQYGITNFGKVGSAYRPAISLSTNNTTPPNLSAEKTLILITPGASTSGVTGPSTSGSNTITRRDSYLYQSPMERHATQLKSKEDTARLAMNKLSLQRSSTHLGINNQYDASKAVPTITENSLTRSNSFMRNQVEDHSALDYSIISGF